MGRKYEMQYNSEYFTVAANDIIKGKQSMTLQTARLIRLLVTQVVKEDKDLKTYSCRITDLATFFNIDSSNLYRNIREICENAMKSVVYIGTGNPKQPWEIFHWLSTAKYDGNGTITLRLSDEIKPYVLQLDKWFTQYQIKNILEFNSFYAIRLYELIKCEDGINGNYNDYEQFEITELRKCFDCEKKYTSFKDFRRNVIEVAVREINNKSDMCIAPIYKKTGRKTTKIVFEIKSTYLEKFKKTYL